MLHIFKLNGHRIAYDTSARRAYPLSALALKMLDSLTPPLTEDCPSALRYAFAKYDSNDLSAAYAELYTLYKNGLLFAKDSSTSAAPASVCTVIETSAPAAVRKVESAIAHGASKLHVYVKEATTCLASTLHETFDEKADIRLILDLNIASLSDDDIASLNGTGDTLWLRTESGSLTADVQSAWERGISSVHTEIPDTDGTQKELARMAKGIESAFDDGVHREFFPFTAALTSLSGFDGASAACAGCWAREICGGRCLTASGNPTSACDTQRTLTECGIILADNV